MEPFWGPKGGSIEPFGVRSNLSRGAIEPSGGFDRTFLGWSPIAGYRFKIPSKFNPAMVSAESIRSGKLQNQSFPNFSNFRPEFCPEFCSEFSPNFLRTFRASFRGRERDQKKFTKNPRLFSMQSSQANTKKLFTKFFWRAGKVKNHGTEFMPEFSSECSCLYRPKQSV